MLQRKRVRPRASALQYDGDKRGLHRGGRHRILRMVKRTPCGISHLPGFFTYLGPMIAAVISMHGALKKLIAHAYRSE
jgi:hypothetical protein